MSATETRMRLAEAEAIAMAFCREIGPYAERMMIAGSIRRGEETVGDIEIVAVPRIETAVTLDMFGEAVGADRIDHLDGFLKTGLDLGVVEKRETHGIYAWGFKYKRLSFEGAPFDLFCCDAERWGVILAIRTGPSAYSHQLVTPRIHKTNDGRPGLLPAHMKVAEGWLTYRMSGERIVTPEERGFFETIGVPYVEPWNRR